MWYKFAKEEWENDFYDPEEDLQKLTDKNMPPNFILKEMSLDDKLDLLSQNMRDIGGYIDERYQIYVFPSKSDNIWKFIAYEPNSHDDKPSVEGTPVPLDKDARHAMGWVKRLFERQGITDLFIDHYESLRDACEDHPFLSDCDYFIGF